MKGRNPIVKITNFPCDKGIIIKSCIKEEIILTHSSYVLIRTGVRVLELKILFYSQYSLYCTLICGCHITTVWGSVTMETCCCLILPLTTHRPAAQRSPCTLKSVTYRKFHPYIQMSEAYQKEPYVKYKYIHDETDDFNIILKETSLGVHVHTNNMSLPFPHVSRIGI